MVSIESQFVLCDRHRIVSIPLVFTTAKDHEYFSFVTFLDEDILENEDLLFGLSIRLSMVFPSNLVFGNLETARKVPGPRYSTE